MENCPGIVVFDCDGTLISSELAVLHTIQHIIAEHQSRDVSEEEVREKYSPDLETLFGNFQIFEQQERDKLIRRFGEVAAETRFNYELFPGISELVKELSVQDYALYVWTARDRYSTRAILTKLGMMPYFFELSCADDAPTKPSPIGLQEMLGPNVDKSKVVMIGDSFTDIFGARNYGCSSIYAQWGGSMTVGEVKELDPTAIAESPKACLDRIKELLA